MEDFNKVEHLVDHVRDYMHVRADEVRLGVADRSSAVIATLVAGALVTAVFFLCFVFIGIAVALLLGRTLNDLVVGFAIVAVLCMIIALFIWVSRRRLIRIPVMNAILHQLLLNNEKDEKD